MPTWAAQVGRGRYYGLAEAVSDRQSGQDWGRADCAGYCDPAWVIPNICWHDDDLAGMYSRLRESRALGLSKDALKKEQGDN